MIFHIPLSILHQKKIDDFEKPFCLFSLFVGIKILNMVNQLYNFAVQPGLFFHLPVRCSGNILSFFNLPFWKASDFALFDGNAGNLYPTFPYAIDTPTEKNLTLILQTTFGPRLKPWGARPLTSS